METIKKMPHKCEECGKVLKGLMFFERHMRLHENPKQYECLVCLKTFKKGAHLRVHLKIHEGGEGYPCELCSKILKSKGSYVIHKKRHLKEYCAKCEICNMGFVTKQGYNNHMGTKHGTNLRHICDICGRSCYDKGALQVHMARHTENYEKNTSIRCPICDKSYLQELYLQRHIRRAHRDANINYVCDLCGKTLKTKQCLKNHMRIHEGVKPNECVECGKSFVRKDILNLHMRIHTGQRPYECKECGKAFTQRTPLKVHMRSHTGEKPYDCAICGFEFITKAAWIIHVENVHKKVDGFPAMLPHSFPINDGLNSLAALPPNISTAVPNMSPLPHEEPNLSEGEATQLTYQS